MYCHTCGVQNDPGHKFCASCGNPLSTTASAPNQTLQKSELQQPSIAPQHQPIATPTTAPTYSQPAGKQIPSKSILKKSFFVPAIISGIVIVIVAGIFGIKNYNEYSGNQKYKQKATPLLLSLKKADDQCSEGVNYIDFGSLEEDINTNFASFKESCSPTEQLRPSFCYLSDAVSASKNVKKWWAIKIALPSYYESAVEKAGTKVSESMGMIGSCMNKAVGAINVGR